MTATLLDYILQITHLRENSLKQCKTADSLVVPVTNDERQYKKIWKRKKYFYKYHCCI